MAFWMDCATGIEPRHTAARAKDKAGAGASTQAFAPGLLGARFLWSSRTGRDQISTFALAVLVVVARHVP